jgi:hypothetical protein
METTRSFWRSRSHFGIGAQRFGVATHCTFFRAAHPLYIYSVKKLLYPNPTARLPPPKSPSPPRLPQGPRAPPPIPISTAAPPGPRRRQARTRPSQGGCLHRGQARAAAAPARAASNAPAKSRRSQIPPPQPNPAGAPAPSLAIRHRKSRVLPPAAPRRFAAGSSSLSSTNPRGLSPSSARPQPGGWPSGPTPPAAGHDYPVHDQQYSDQGNTTSSEGYYQIIRFWDFFVDCYLNLCTRNSNLVSLMYCSRDFGLIKD